MKILKIENIAVLALVFAILGMGATRGLTDELDFDTYVHCGDYLAPSPDVNLTRWAAGDMSPQPMWSLTYATKNPTTKVRTEVSCVITDMKVRVDGSTLFTGKDCQVVLAQEADKTFSVTFEDQPKIGACVFDLPREQEIADFNSDLAHGGVVAPN